MTYDTDPTRWTDAPGAAPDVLRDAFTAARNEGPSDLQMRALSLKLTALGGGVASAAQASVAQASTTATGASAVGTAAGASTLPLGKLAIAVALLGSVAASTVAYRSLRSPSTAGERPSMAEPTTAAEAPSSTPAIDEPRHGADKRELERSGRAQPERAQPVERAKPSDRTRKNAETRQQAQPSDAVAEAESTRAPLEREGVIEREERRERRRAARSERSALPLAAPPESANEAGRGDSRRARTVSDRATELQTPEIELLRRARESLDARPHEAYRLTEAHRQTYPQGVFAQERDALAIEALLRSGELKLARSHAEDFIEKYPSSPHAHRFRESMGIR